MMDKDPTAPDVKARDELQPRGGPRPGVHAGTAPSDLLTVFFAKAKAKTLAGRRVAVAGEIPAPGLPPSALV